MRRVASVVVTSTLWLVIAFQTALVVGAPWGHLTQGGSIEGALPLAGRLLALVSIVILVVFWLGLSGRAGWGPARRWPTRRLSVISWTAVGYGVMAIVLNAATPSALERAVWLPISSVILICELVIAWPNRAGRVRAE